MNGTALKSKSGSEPLHYVAIKTCSLLEERNAAFELYIAAEESATPVLYCKSNASLVEAGLSRLASNGIETLYIQSDDVAKYQQYIENNISTILHDNEIPSQEKMGILYESTHHMMSAVFTDPRSTDSIRRGRKMIEHTVDYLLEQGDVLGDLHQVMAYDYHVYTHSVNVCVYGLSLALRSGIIDPDALKDFGSGLLLHDVGKSEIDPEIVNCPGKLTDAQFDEMKMHTVYGYEILDSHAETTPLILDVTRHHHEKLHGRGYPDGLSEDKISNFVRIATIADIFDALTTKRVYKDELTTYDALQLMAQEESSGLDTAYLNTFVQMLGLTQRSTYDTMG